MKTIINGKEVNISKLRVTKVINLGSSGWHSGHHLTDGNKDLLPCEMNLLSIFFGYNEDDASHPGFNYDVGAEFLGEDFSRLFESGFLEEINDA